MSDQARRRDPLPTVTREGVLPPGGGGPIALDSAAWFAWLAEVDAFVFETPAGSYTARRERRGDGGRYWRAARKQAGRLRRAYLGLTPNLTRERLTAVARLLLEGEPPPSVAATSGRASPIRAWPPPPLGEHTVPRPRLLQRLDAAAGKALTLVSGPAGGGKTTLLAAWARRLRRRGAAVAWISLAGAPATPEQLWSTVAEACAWAAGALPGGPGELPEAPDSPARRALSALAALPAPVVLVLDGYEAAGDGAHHAVAGALLAAPELPVRLAVGARGRPPLPLATLRASDALAEIHPAELDCTAEEAAQLLGLLLGRDPSADELAPLLAQSEGWVTGLRLAALAMRDGADAPAAADGAHPYLSDYLMAEVMAPLPAALQEALRDAGPLGTVSAGLYAAVAGCAPAEAAAALGALARAGAMVTPLDPGGQEYRVHPQLAAALRASGERGDPDRLRAALARAARWCADGQPERAIDLALDAHDHALAAELLAEHGTAQLLLGRVGAVRRRLARLPAPLRRGHARLTVLAAWEAILGGRHDLARAHAAAARALAPRLADEEARAAVEGEALAALAIAALADHDWHAVARHAAAAADVLPASNHYLHGLLERLRALGPAGAGPIPGESPLGAFARVAAAAEVDQQAAVAVAAHCQAADLARGRGALQAAAQGYRRALRLADAAGRPPVAALALVGLGALAYERDELDEAARLLRDGAALAEGGGLVATAGDGLFLLGRTMLARGEAAAAEAAGARLQALDLQVGLPAGLRARHAALEVALALERDDRAGIAARLPELLAGVAGAADTALLIPLVRALLVRGEPERALALAAEARAGAEALADGAPDLRARTAEALALDARAEGQAALELLTPALRRAEREGWARGALDGGPPMVPLLSAARAAGVAPAFAADLLVRLGATPGPDGPPLVEALTPREREILRLLAAGEPIAAIAAALGLGASTVKWHAANLYGKLGVAGRAQAVARGRSLNLL